MRSRFALFVSLLAFFAVPAYAILPPSRPQVLVLDARTPAELREVLSAYADSAAATKDPGLVIEAGEASALLGASWSRAGQRDSALAAFRRALEWRGNPEDVTALAEEHLLRGERTDRDAVIALLEGQGGMRLIGTLRRRIERDGLLAWTRFQGGDSAAVNALDQETVNLLSERPEWRGRLGRMLLASGRSADAYRVLVPAAVESRQRDWALLTTLRTGAERAGRGAALQTYLDREVALSDTADERAVRELGARRLTFRGDDGEIVGGVVVGASPTRRRAAIVLLPDGTSFRAADSLAAQLRRAGLIAFFLDPRGSRRSASADAPTRRAWAGREDDMQLRVARDVRAALAALARVTPVDTTRYVVAGAGEMAPVAVGAAWLDRRAAVLMLIAPAPAAPDRGPMRAALAALQRPTYLQIGPEEFDASEFANRLADACDPRLVRVADAAAPGRGVEVFRAGAIVGKRFTDWLRDQWPAPAAPRRATTTRRR